MNRSEALASLEQVQARVSAGRAALDEALAERDSAVAKAHATGVPVTEIAAALGVNRAMAYRILERSKR